MKQTLQKQFQKMLQSLGIVYYKKAFMPFGICVYEDMKRLRPDCTNRVLFDVGANIGQTYIEMRKKNPHAYIYCFEPASQPYRKLQEISFSDKLSKVYHSAVGEQNGECTIQTGDDSVWNKVIDPEQLSPLKNVETVKKITIDHIINQENISHIDLLKTDTEGYDLPVLKGASDALLAKRIKFIFTEVTFRANDSQRSHFYDIFHFLSKAEYEFVCLYDLSLVGKPRTLEFCNALFVAKQ